MTESREAEPVDPYVLLILVFVGGAWAYQEALRPCPDSKPRPADIAADGY